MSITVSDAMQLNQLKALELIAGKKGLEKRIDKIGILDHEIIEGISGQFMKGDFVITSFTAARNDVDMMTRCIKDLIACEISAIAIKKIYFKELPQYIIDLADESALPIFMFEPHIFYEDIIEELMVGIQTRSHIELLASKIEILFKNDLKSDTVKLLANELNRYFFDEHITIYCKNKTYLSDEALIKLADRYQRSRNKSIYHSVFKYEDGLLIVLSYRKISDREIMIDLDHIFNQLHLISSEFNIGKSRMGYTIENLDQSIKESIYAREACEIQSSDILDYDQIGIYKILLPYAKEKWLKSFSESILSPIRNHDNGTLIETAKIFIKTGGDMQQTAQLMFQHINTIRYRMNTIQKLMQINNTIEFYEQLSIAIKCEALMAH